MFAVLGLGMQELTILILVALMMFALPIIAVILALTLARNADHGMKQEALEELEEEVEHLRKEVERLRIGPGD
jgi:hypothetical protein